MKARLVDGPLARETFEGYDNIPDLIKVSYKSTNKHVYVSTGVTSDDGHALYEFMESE